MYEDQRSNVFNLRLINQVRSQTAFALPFTYIQYDMDIHDFDREIVNVSIRLSEDIMVYRLIGNIRVSMSKRDMQQLQMKGPTQ